MKKPHAFSLTEVLVAITVIAVGIIPIFIVFSRGASGTHQTKDEILAYTYCSELLAFAQTKEYQDPFLQVGKRDQKIVSVHLADGGIFPLKMDPDFERWLTVVEFQPDPSYQIPFSYKVITSEVRKTTGIVRKIRLSTLKYRGAN